MAQLYYRYGTMNSGKTIEILKVAYNYEEQGKGVVIMTSALDTRDGVGYVSSRIGMKALPLRLRKRRISLALSVTYQKHLTVCWSMRLSFLSVIMFTT